MGFLTSGPARLIVLVVVAVGLAAGGIAWADIPDSGVIHGCYKNGSGDLRVIDSDAEGRCLGSERPLDWSQTSALSAHRFGGPVDAPAGADYTTIVTLHVDPGSYVVAAKTVIAVVATDPGTSSDCNLTYDAGGGDVVADHSNQLLPGLGSTPRTTQYLQRLLQFATPATIRLECRVGTVWTASFSSIIAIPIQNALNLEVSG
jgi:hypothetical protein